MKKKSLGGESYEILRTRVIKLVHKNQSFILHVVTIYDLIALR
jgi:hypothetical protein